MILSSDMYRGVTTGLNEAFIVTDEVRDSLIAEDPRSAEIIKPVLRGRDIQRYKAQWQGLWLIATFPSLRLDINDYPAVKRCLLSYGRERLEQSGKILPDGSKSRKKTPHHWFELQDTCAYHEAFATEKLYWRRVARDGLFSYVEEELQCVNAVFMLNGKSLKYLCAVLNAKLISWLMQRLLPTSGTGTFHWEKVHVERLPRPSDPHRRGGSVHSLGGTNPARKSLLPEGASKRSGK